MRAEKLEDLKAKFIWDFDFLVSKYGKLEPFDSENILPVVTPKEKIELFDGDWEYEVDIIEKDMVLFKNDVEPCHISELNIVIIAQLTDKIEEQFVTKNIQ